MEAKKQDSAFKNRKNVGGSTNPYSSNSAIGKSDSRDHLDGSSQGRGSPSMHYERVSVSQNAMSPQR